MKIASPRHQFDIEVHKLQGVTAATNVALALCALLIAFASNAQDTLSYAIVATHPHDANAFTQGLAYANGRIYESTGLYGHSGAWIKKPETGAIVRAFPLGRSVFGEGLAVGGASVVQVTWKDRVAYVYDLKLRRTREFRYEGEGWGLAWDGVRWRMSDGSADIVARSPADFAEVSRVTVRAGGKPVTQLNELEYANGVLYANIWHSDAVAVIDPASGEVRHWLDLSALKRDFAKPQGWDEREHVLNGIAWNPDHGTFFVTGKCWPVLYEIRLTAKAD